ncbi:glutamine--fructose-6-phosphate transaminase (isomerizing) [Kiritimatiellaeota bacterium B1221]|nr:glutamine--fructose-6-phosphate transaminase (isomerizing) [Kiritimatiellaeota bacterium B1221]
MCGIVGMLGNRNAVPVLIEGLKRLEYRGYDSAGVAVQHETELELRRAVGRLSELENELTQHPLSSTIGIGHTRWATHGEASVRNCHPHTASEGRLALVHNGIIENYQELKGDLAGKGFPFQSDTDTEVLAAHVADCTAEGDFLEGLRRALAGARGAYAIGLLSLDQPGVLYAARLGSPLIVGKGRDGVFIASDVPAILPQVDEVIYLEDGEVARLSGDGVEIWNLAGEAQELKWVKVEMEDSAVDSGGFETFMLKEVHEQTRVVRGLMDQYVKDGKISFPDLDMSVGHIRTLQRMMIVSCGTAYYAAMYGRLLIEHFTSIAVETDLGSEFRYRSPKIQPGTLVATVSQSGETADTLASVQMAKKAGCPILTICNVFGSSLVRESDHLIYTHAGPEIGVASTKAFTAQLMVFVLLTLHLAEARGELTPESREELLAELQKIPTAIHRVLENKEHIKEIASRHHDGPSSLYLGRRFNYPMALEGALKNKEISYQHAEGYAAGEMKHGPIALINESLPVICICTETEDEVAEKMISNVREVQARAGRIIAIATEGDQRLNDITRDIIFVPRTTECLSPLVNVVALQLIAYYAAQARGTDIDKPRNLAKSVTVE